MTVKYQNNETNNLIFKGKLKPKRHSVAKKDQVPESPVKFEMPTDQESFGPPDSPKLSNQIGT